MSPDACEFWNFYWKFMYGKEKISEKYNHGEGIWVIFGPYPENGLTMLWSILHGHAKNVVNFQWIVLFRMTEENAI